MRDVKKVLEIRLQNYSQLESLFYVVDQSVNSIILEGL